MKLEDVINEKIVIYRKKKEEIIKQLYENKYYQLIDKSIINEISLKNKNGYDYLIKMSIYLCTEEEIEKLEKEYIDNKERYDILNIKKIEEMWLEECDEFIKRYKKVSKVVI